MHRFTKISFLFCLAALLVILPAFGAFAQTADPATADDEAPDFGAVAADLVFARPLGIVSTVLGAAVYIVSLPFSLPGGNSKAVWHSVVEKPAVFTFVRPMGEFD